MLRIIVSAAFVLAAGMATAGTIEVKMLNKGEAGAMVFEPAFIKAEPGDVIHFVPTDKGHDVESIDGMLPDGVEHFKSEMSEEFDLTVEKDGLYGIKCSPHYGLGMVALIEVGTPANLDAAKAVKQPGKAKKRMAELFEQVQ